MRAASVFILTLLTCGCATQKEYAGIALEIPAPPEGTSSRIWNVTKSKVAYTVAAIALENRMTLGVVSKQKNHGGFVRYDRNAETMGMTLLFSYHDQINPMMVETTEIGVSHPTRANRDLMHELQDRLEAAGVEVHPTFPHVVVTF